MKKKKLIAGNWKMNGDVALAQTIVDGIKDAADQSNHDVVIAPPFVYLPQVALWTKESNIQLSAQNLAKFDQGAYTGEVSGKMLKDIGCQYVLVGHSERRQYFGETNEIVAEKVDFALKNGLTPILCVGETLEERESDAWKSVIEAQLESVVKLIGIEAFNNVVVAYEPVWAIGTGKSASAEIANEVHAFIFCTLTGKSDSIRDSLRILYGGSVTADNSAQYMAMSHIDGVLVGGASLKPDAFSQIIRSVE
ncbi:triose-phosphate isomerase [Wohlfahrtiimonas sp. G9077]|uniref:triose-phosphate isomerase n=1 Tax=Wohlfahrtiimonas sp. G9077 TaxID=1980118 RepID=UPI000B97E9FB|nr:triose-phosphate isomerase [Wohlfahrtiimonas sp. G9077]OYQ74560.1 triose-phosphate isomerase [Wohlfahrtiimonas sp. G9077]